MVDIDLPTRLTCPSRTLHLKGPVLHMLHFYRCLIWHALQPTCLASPLILERHRLCLQVLANMAAARAGYKSVQDASDALVDGLYASLNSDRMHHPQVPTGPALPPPGSHAFQMLLRQPIPIPKLFTASRAQQQQQQGPGPQAQTQMQPPQQAEASSSGRPH